VSLAAAGIPTTWVGCTIAWMLEQETVQRPDRANLLVAGRIVRRVHNVFYLKGHSPLILTSPNSFELHVVEESTQAMRFLSGLPTPAAARRGVVCVR